MNEEEKCCDDTLRPEAAPATSPYEDPKFLTMQARSAGLAHAIDLSKANLAGCGTDGIVENAQKFADFLLG